MEMNHFCLNVLHRITIPDFLDFMRSVFPYLYAVDTNNISVIDLHIPDQAYFVMHEHVVKFRFPNLVGGFSPELKAKLEAMASRNENLIRVNRLQSAVKAVFGRRVARGIFETPHVGRVNGKLQTDSVPEKMSPGSVVEIAVTLINEGQETWYGYGNHPVLLSYHWLNADGTTYQHDGLRTPLACEALEPGKTSQEKVVVIAPEQEGRYQLILTLVQEGVCWFEDRGFQQATLQVVVE